MRGHCAPDPQDLRQVRDSLRHLPGDADLAPVDEVHQEAEGGEGDVIEDDDWVVTGAGTRQELREVVTAGAEDNLMRGQLLSNNALIIQTLWHFRVFPSTLSVMSTNSPDLLSLSNVEARLDWNSDHLRM